MKIQSAVTAMAIAFGMVAGACSATTDTSGSGGKGSGGGGGTASGPTCDKPTDNVNACGGDVTGEWTVGPSCLTVSDTIDVTRMGIGCTSVGVSGIRNVSGTWTATSDGKYTDKTTTTGTEKMKLDAKCLEVSGTTTTCERLGSTIQSNGYDTVDCQPASGGGCDCTANIKQNSGMGYVTLEPPPNGRFTTADNALKTNNDTEYSYCVSGDKMSWTPKINGPTIKGAIAFQKSGGTGSGGAAGEGAGGSGGAAGAGAGGSGGGGGATGKGGQTTGAGGTVPAGGRTGSGGVTSPGGTTGSGGVTGPGGSTGPGGRTGSGGTTTGSGGSTVQNNQGPCDIYEAASTPCVAAYSMVRVLSSKYSGALYQVRKDGQKTGSGGTTQDIKAVDGFADAASQDSFCEGASTCTVSKLYDQSGKGNDLTVAKKGCYTGTAGEDDYESTANKRPVKVSGHNVYALYMNPHEGYRNNSGTGIATGTGAQGIYDVADGKRTPIGDACCWDFGNASKDNCYGPTGSMNALYFGTGYWGKGVSPGPWFLGDFEAGVWATGSGSSGATNNNLPSMNNTEFAFGILKTSTTDKPQYAIRVGDATTGALKTAYDGQAPANWQGKGGIILGIGGDNSNSSRGTFFEGAMTAGRPSDATEDSVLKNVQAAKYGQ
jgi:non-reducing end alpha-L-arabinofuranosidase